MKLLKNQLPILFAFVISFSTFAQSTQFKTTRNLGFKESSKTQEITINIKEKTAGLSLEILCVVREGMVTIEIYDPSGQKQGEFAVESVESEDDGSLFSALADGVSGEIKKSVRDPQLGKWIVKFIPKNATGRVTINSVQVQ